ncbi:MAG: hypothetical protein R2772_10325 [Chitinophagales bacterium]
MTELPLITGVFDTTICNGASFVFNGTTYDASNLSGTEVFTATNGCDSLVADSDVESHNYEVFRPRQFVAVLLLFFNGPLRCF